MAHRRCRMPLALLVAAAGWGCSGSGPKNPAPTTTTASVASLKQQYFALVAPVNAELGRFSVPRSATGPGLAQLAAPLISALTTLDRKLPMVAWPAKIRKDIDALIGADKVLEADLQRAKDQTPNQLAAWESQLHVDGTKLDAKVSGVLVDLGQPPLTSPATGRTTTTGPAGSAP